MASSEFSTSDYGWCSVCRQWRAVKKNGTMRQHLGDIWVGGRATMCRGTAHPPLDALAGEETHV